MLLELIVAAQSVSPTLLAQADARNEAFVACLFSVSREARAHGLTSSQFQQRLTAACRTEEQELRAISVRILKLRGHSAANAANQTAKLMDEARRAVVTAYRQPF